ncbi:MAG: hypothetical protein V1754_08805 [Pseudomonadota bacterium]
MRVLLAIFLVWAQLVFLNNQAQAQPSTVKDRPRVSLKAAAQRVRIRAQNFTKTKIADAKKNITAAAQKLSRSKAAQNGKRALSYAGAFGKGLFVDGPKDTWQGIRQHPKAFVGGLAAIVAGGLALDFFGIDAHNVLVGLSAVAATYEAAHHVKDVKNAKSGKDRARALGRITYSPALVGVTAFGGATIAGSPHVGALGRLDTPLHIAQRMASHTATTGDIPTILVTATQSRRNGKHHGMRTPKSLKKLGAALREKTRAVRNSKVVHTLGQPVDIRALGRLLQQQK